MGCTARLPGDSNIKHLVKMMRRIATLLILLVMIPLLTLPVSARADMQERAYKLKAAYLFNFTKFISWPDTAFSSNESPFIFCILGKNPFGSILESLESKTVRNRKIEVRYCSELTGVKGCHLLFISTSEKVNIDTILASVTRLPMVTVSDIPNFAQASGMMEFVEKESRLRFAINLDTAKLNDLQVNSQLLNLATRVVWKGK